MKYNNINLLDARIEKIISSTVKHYYTDWKHYDRPKYMKCKGSADKADKELILIARTCGTYLVKMADIKAGDNWANTLIEYYSTQETADFYYINLRTLEVKQIKPEAIKKAA
jgi:hypothetical protein